METFLLDSVLGTPDSCGAESFMDGFWFPIVPLGYPIRQSPIAIEADCFCRSPFAGGSAQNTRKRDYLQVVSLSL